MRGMRFSPLEALYFIHHYAMCLINHKKCLNKYGLVAQVNIYFPFNLGAEFYGIAHLF